MDILTIIISLTTAYFGSIMIYHYGEFQKQKSRGLDYRQERKKFIRNRSLFGGSAIVLLLGFGIYQCKSSSDSQLQDKEVTHYIYNEEFNKPTEPWHDQVEKVKSSSKVEKGRLLIKSKNDKTQSRHDFINDFDLNKDFMIESSIKFIGGGINGYSGLDWGVDESQNNLFNFSISKNKTVSIYGYTINKGKIELFSSERENAIQPKNFNRIKIIFDASSEMYTFLINDIKVANLMLESILTKMKLGEVKYFGQNVGISVAGESELLVDYLRISNFLEKNIH